MARREGTSHPYAIEINLRNGGTTHPALTLLALTDGTYDLVDRSRLGWDDETQTGAALHMVSAVASAGRLGATAIGNSPEQAQQHYDALARCLDNSVGIRA